jgi:hypothetical protein
MFASCRSLFDRADVSAQLLEHWRALMNIPIELKVGSCPHPKMNTTSGWNGTAIDFTLAESQRVDVPTGTTDVIVHDG